VKSRGYSFQQEVLYPLPPGRLPESAKHPSSSRIAGPAQSKVNLKEALRSIGMLMWQASAPSRFKSE